MPTNKGWDQSIQELIDMIAKPNWKEADRHSEIARRLFNACFEVWIAARKHATQTVTVTSVMYMSIWNELHWAFISAMTGAYLAAIRAFRFVFEYAVQSWVLEEKYKNLPEDDEKIDTVLEDGDSKQFKSYMIDRLKFLDVAEVKSAQDLYHRLSEFVHPQSKILATFNADSLATFDMNPSLLKICADFAVGVADILGVILVQRYPTLIHEPELIEIAMELGLKMTSSRLRQQNFWGGAHHETHTKNDGSNLDGVRISGYSGHYPLGFLGHNIGVFAL